MPSRQVGATPALSRSIGARGGMSAWRLDCRPRIHCLGGASSIPPTRSSTRSRLSYERTLGAGGTPSQVRPGGSSRHRLPGDGLRCLDEWRVRSGRRVRGRVFCRAVLCRSRSDTRNTLGSAPQWQRSFQVSVRARDLDWVEYASGHIARCKEPSPPDRDIERILARCQCARWLDDAHRTEQEKFFNFGPRWHCLKAINIGEKEALAELELARPYSRIRRPISSSGPLRPCYRLGIVSDRGLRTIEFCLFPHIL